jgi:hypothetical protein
MSDQQVKYTITADASQANSELAKVDKAAASLVNQERALADSIARASKTLAAEEKAAAAAAKAIADHGAESAKAAKAVAAHERAVEQSAKAMLAQQRATEDLAAATKKAADAAMAQGRVATTTAASTETLRQRIGKSAEGLSKQAAAISLVSSSMEGMGGQVGKMVAGAGQMAAAFGAGGPFAVALVGGIALIQGVTDHFEAARLEAERLDDVKFHKMTDGIVKLSKAVQDIKTETQGLLRELNPEGAKVQDLFAVAEESMKLRADANKLSNQSMAADKVIAFADRQRMRKEADLMLQKADALEAKVLVMNKLIEKDNKPKSGGASKATEKRSDLGVRFLSSEAGAAERTRGLAIDAEIANDAWVNALKIEADAREEQARMDKQSTEEARRQAEERAKIAEDEASKKQDVAERQAAFVTGQLMQTSSVIAQSAVAAAKGQEDAGAILLQGLAQQAGDLITLKGAESAATGLSMLFTGNPAGAVPLAGGLALIGAGQAIAIGGAEVAASMISGASRTPSTDKGAARDKGASPGRGGGSGGGGPLVVNVAYGAGGPLPEDTAREIQKAVDTGRRRGGR